MKQRMKFKQECCIWLNKYETYLNKIKKKSLILFFEYSTKEAGLAVIMIKKKNHMTGQIQDLGYQNIQETTIRLHI